MKPPSQRNRPLFFRILKRFFFGYKVFFEKCVCIFIGMQAPVYYLILMLIVRPVLLDFYKPRIWTQIFEASVTLFGFINVFGNYLLGVYTDTKLRKSIPYSEGIDHCDECKLWRPPQTWHCRSCHACILRRDHHCMIFARCIGLRNLRHFLLYIVYIVLSLIYVNIYMYLYLRAECGNNACQAMDPIRLYRTIVLVVLFKQQVLFENSVIDVLDTKWQVNLIVFLWRLNFLWFLWASCMFYKHGCNAYKGITSWESDKRKQVKNCVIYNLRRIFGLRWYWTFVWPFTKSMLPNDFTKIKQV